MAPQTALKALITLHRLMRESEPTFMDELVRYRWALAGRGAWQLLWAAVGCNSECE